jgi:hypothetical protein
MSGASGVAIAPDALPGSVTGGVTTSVFFFLHAGEAASTVARTSNFKVFIDEAPCAELLTTTGVAQHQ